MLYAGGEERGRMLHLPRTLLRRIFVKVVTRWKEDLGAELFEAALVVPILLMLLLGIVSFGNAYHDYQTITRAAREGAKAAVLPPCALAASGGCPGSNAPYTSDDVWTNFVLPVLKTGSLITSSTVQTQVQTSYTLKYVWMDPPTDTVCGVQLSLKYPYTFALPFTSMNLSTINLSTKVQMRLEEQPTTCSVGNDY